MDPSAGVCIPRPGPRPFTFPLSYYPRPRPGRPAPLRNKRRSDSSSLGHATPFFPPDFPPRFFSAGISHKCGFVWSETGASTPPPTSRIVKVLRPSIDVFFCTRVFWKSRLQPEHCLNFLWLPVQSSTRDYPSSVIASTPPGFVPFLPRPHILKSRFPPSSCCFDFLFLSVTFSGQNGQC